MSCLQNIDRQSSCPSKEEEKASVCVTLLQREGVSPEEAQENCPESVAAQSQDARDVSCKYPDRSAVHKNRYPYAMCIVVLSGPTAVFSTVQAKYVSSISRPCLSLHCLTTRMSLQLSSSVTLSLSLFLGRCAVLAPRVVCRKISLPKLCPRDFSASRTARLRDVVWSRLRRIRHGVRAVGFCLVHQNPAAPL